MRLTNKSVAVLFVLTGIISLVLYGLDYYGMILVAQLSFATVICLGVITELRERQA